MRTERVGPLLGANVKSAFFNQSKEIPTQMTNGH